MSARGVIDIYGLRSVYSCTIEHSSRTGGPDISLRETSLFAPPAPPRAVSYRAVLLFFADFFAASALRLGGSVSRGGEGAGPHKLVLPP